MVVFSIRALPLWRVVPLYPHCKLIAVEKGQHVYSIFRSGAVQKRSDKQIMESPAVSAFSRACLHRSFSSRLTPLSPLPNRPVSRFTSSRVNVNSVYAPEWTPRRSRRDSCFKHFCDILGQAPCPRGQTAGLIALIETVEDKQVSSGAMPGPVFRTFTEANLSDSTAVSIVIAPCIGVYLTELPMIFVRIR